MSNELIIPEFTAEDYKTSAAPYEWLYKQRNNKFLLTQLRGLMAEKAGALGVLGFKATFQAYCETMRQKEGVVDGRVTEFVDQPLELECGEYICADECVSRLDNYGFTQIVCRHPIMPTMRLINIDSGEERLEIAYRRSSTWRRIVVEKAVIASSNKILDLAAVGIFVNSDNAKALSTYLLAMEAMNYDKLPELKSVGRLGWIKSGGFSPYVEGLRFDGDVNYGHIFDSISTHGSFDAWKDAMIKLRAEKTVARIFLAASFASVLLEPCGLLPFFVHAWGGQGTGKTVSLMVAASVWANPRMGDYVSSFNSTDVGQEMLAAFLNHMPLCMDELQVQAAAGAKDFDRIIYKLCEGQGKVRGAKTGGIRKTTTWQNCILTTGEYPILSSHSMAGAVVRVIEAECTKPMSADLVGLCATIRENYGWAGPAFVKMMQIDGAAGFAKGLHESYYQKLIDTDVDAKQAGSAAIILTADALATSNIFHDNGELTVEEMSDFLKKKIEVDANARALDYLYQLVAANPTHFKPDNFNEYHAEVWGKKDESYIYIVKAIFDREMQNAGFNPTAFLSWAKRRGILECDNDGRRTKSSRIAGSTVKTVCIARDFDDIRDSSP